MIETLGKFIAFLQGGLVVTAIGFVGMHILRLFEPIFGYETNSSQDFKILFDRLYYWLLGGVEKDVGAISSSPRKTQALLTISIAGVVTLYAIAVELWGMIAITGAAVAGYHFFGVIPDLPTWYNLLVFGATLFAFSLMTRGSVRAQEIPSSSSK